MSEDREWIKPLVVAGIWSVVSLAIVLGAAMVAVGLIHAVIPIVEGRHGT